jgi:hypothetical protein
MAHNVNKRDNISHGGFNRMFILDCPLGDGFSGYLEVFCK